MALDGGGSHLRLLDRVEPDLDDVGGGHAACASGMTKSANAIPTTSPMKKVGVPLTPNFSLARRAESSIACIVSGAA